MKVSSTPPFDCVFFSQHQLTVISPTRQAVVQTPPTKVGDVVEALLETEAEQAEWQDHELESGDDAQYDLPWEVWVCVLSSMDDPRDLCSFGLACRLFQAITQTYSRSHPIAMQTSS